MYHSECVACFCIDNPPHVMSFYRKFSNNNDKNITHIYPTNTELRNSLKIIKNTTNKTIANHEIDNVYKLVQYKSSQDRIKYYDAKLYVPTAFFRASFTNPKQNTYQTDWNIYGKKEKKLFEQDKNLQAYLFMQDANHFIWNNQEYSDIIIKTIRKICTR